MYPRTNYEMTEADLEKILDACKPTPVIMIGSFTGSTPQENANRAWAELGQRMGFDHMTVQPVENAGMRFFTAVPSENEVQRSERLAKEAEEKRQAELFTIREQIRVLEMRKEQLTLKE